VEILTLNRKGHGLLELAIDVQHAEWFLSHLMCGGAIGAYWWLIAPKKEIQILNSLAGVPHFRDEKKEITMVTS